MVTIDIGLGLKVFQVTNNSAYFVRLYFMKKKVLKLLHMVYFSLSLVLRTNKIDRLCLSLKLFRSRAFHKELRKVGESLALLANNRLG
jgi:hypothetical protein